MTKTPPPDRDSDMPAGTVPVLSSGDLLAGHREVIIQHGSDRYRLRLTSNGKLILIK